MKLYPAQQQAVNKALARRKPVRYFFAAATGAGKTAMAISTIKALGCAKILIVCPAIVRLAWKDEFDKWWSGHGEVGIIDVGRERKSISKKGAIKRDAAYASPIQVVSYDLVGELDAQGWEAIVIDEAHGLGNPESKQSKLLSWLVDANRSAHILMLTATPIPTEVKQLWYPLYLLEGEKWGRPSRTGGVSWEFANKYCHIETTEYGTSIGPLREDRRDVLSERLKPIMARLTMKDIVADMPPINASVLHTNKINKDFFKEWLKCLEEDVKHAIIFVHLKKTAAIAAEVADSLGINYDYLDGTVSSTQRAETIKELATRDHSLLIATYDSLSVGIRLLYAQKVVICELSGSPKTTGQVLGRFAAVGSTMRPKVQIAVSPDEEGAAMRLLERVDSLSAVIGAAESENAITNSLSGHVINIEQSMINLFDDFEEKEGWEQDNDTGRDF